MSVQKAFRNTFNKALANAQSPCQMAARCGRAARLNAWVGAWLLCGAAAWGQEIPWHLGRLDGGQAAPAAINTAGHPPGPYPVVVAVVDSGVMPDHPSLQGRLLPGYDMVSARLNLRKGRSGDYRPDDRDARCGSRLFSGAFRLHGTEVASLIAGNGVDGVMGVNPQAHIVPVRLFGACATSRQDLLDAIAWAAGLPVAGLPDNPHPARVINLSLAGGFGVCAPDLQSLIQRVVDKDIFVVAAAGNNFNKPLQEPANCQGVISVGALNAQNQIATYSALDPRTVLYAPGGGPALAGDAQWSVNKLKVASYEASLWGTEHPSAQYRGVGTSYAAPIVAGFISLWLSHGPGKKPADFINALAQFSRQVEPLPGCPSCKPRGLASFQTVKNSELAQLQ